jgi:hydroxymethylbilane synthase
MTVTRIGTRASALALAQSRLMADRLRRQVSDDVVLVEITSRGDRDRSPLVQIGGTGVFVSALRDALMAGEIDLAVHSLKDLPTAPAQYLTLAAIPEREDPRDVLVARDGLALAELPKGSVVGTGSPRRAAQIRALGLGLRVDPIRGNVDTRISLVQQRRVDAVVLAKAGLSRLGRIHEVTETFDPLLMLPAPGQGALAIECREGDAAMIAVLSALDHPSTRSAVTAERSLLAALEAGCTAPVGALAEIASGEAGEELWLRAVVAATDGSRVVRMSMTGAPGEASELGQKLAQDMLAEGVGALTGEAGRDSA